MQLTSSQQAALPGLLTQISSLNQIVTQIQALVNDPSATLTGNVSVFSTAAGNDNLQLPALTPQESAPFFTAALGVFQNRLTALQSELTAL